MNPFQRTEESEAEFNFQVEAVEIEAQLKAAAPTIPPALRSRTLMRCAAQRDAQNRNRRRGQLRWAWTIAGLCLIHWGAGSYLDAQNAAIINGKASPTLVASAQQYAPDLRVFLVARSRLLAALVRDSGEPILVTRDAG